MRAHSRLVPGDVSSSKLLRATVIALLLIFAGELTAQTGTPSSNEARDSAWRAQIRHALFIPERLPDLDTKVWSAFSPMHGVLADRVSYATADGMLVPAIVYYPDLKVLHLNGKLPGLVIVNGHGSDKFGWYAMYSGMLFAQAGAVVVTYDPIGEGERNAARISRQNPSPHDKIVPPPPGISPDDWGRHLGGLMQVDLLQAVSYLLSRRDVDSKRIAVAGYSMGSFVAGIEGAYDLRVRATLLSGGGTFDGTGEYFDSSKLPCQGPPYHALSVLGDRGAVLYDLNADRGPMFVMNGEADAVMNIPLHNQAWFAAVRQRAIALHGSDNNMFTTVFYPGVGHRPSWLDLDGVLWLNQQLRFPAWPTAASVAKAGTTHVSSWIASNHVDISPSAVRENGEGGIEAVGTNLPAIPRSNLMVFPDADWQRLRDRLIYESWAAKTLAAEQSSAPPAISPAPN